MRPCLAVTLTHCWNESVWGRVARVVAAGVPDTPQIVRPEPRKPRMRQHRLNEAQVAALVADYQSGMSTGELARKYVVDTETAARWLAGKLGLTPGGRIGLMGISFSGGPGCRGGRTPTRPSSRY